MEKQTRDVFHSIWDEVWHQEVNLAVNNIFIHFNSLLYFMWSNKEWFSWRFFTYMNIIAADFMPLFTFQITS